MRKWATIPIATILLTGCLASSGDAVVHRAPGPHAALGTVAVLPVDDRGSRQSTADLVPLLQGCRAGLTSAGAAVLAQARVDVAMEGRSAAMIDDQEAARIGARMEADVVVIISFWVGHFSSAVEARIVRSKTATVEATAHTEGSADWFELARKACDAVAR